MSMGNATVITGNRDGCFPVGRWCSYVERLTVRRYLVVSVAQLVARRTHDRKVVGSIPTNAVCFTVVR